MTPSSAPTYAPPTVIKAESSADFLALLPAFTGYTVTNSLLVILFLGNKSFGSLRFDLPPDFGPDECTSLAHAVAQVVREIPQIDGVAFAIMTEKSSSPGVGAPWQAFARRLKSDATRSGLVLRDSCCVAADGWCSYLSPEPGGVMRPLSEIQQNLAGLEASVVTEDAIPDMDQLGRLPLADPARAADVRHRIDELSAKPGRASRGTAFTAPRFSALVARSGVVATVNDAARLSVTASENIGWLRLICAAISATVVDGLPSGPMGSPDAGPISEVNYVADCLDRGGAFDDPTELTRAYGPLEHALILFASVPPDRSRCRRAIELLAEVTAHVPRERRPGLLCLIAWLWWWVGLASVAAKHVEAALNADPTHRLSNMLGHLVDSGQFPLWTLDIPRDGARSA